MVAVEVVGLLAAFTVFGCPIADLRQGVVGVGNDSMVFAVVEHPFFAEVVADLEHFAVGRGDLVEVVLTQFRF